MQQARDQRVFQNWKVNILVQSTPTTTRLQMKIVQPSIMQAGGLVIIANTLQIRTVNLVIRLCLEYIGNIHTCKHSHWQSLIIHK